MHANEVPSKDGEKYVVVKVEKDATTSTQASSDAGKDEDIKCPEILYKVQYKDVGGEIKGTKELAAPYKLKKTTYVNTIVRSPIRC